MKLINKDINGELKQCLLLLQKEDFQIILKKFKSLTKNTKGKRIEKFTD